MQPGLLKRMERRRKLLEKLCRMVDVLREKLGSVTLILYGSYARGDFNAWSDVDLILVWEGFSSRRVPERYRLLRDILASIDEHIDLIPWSVEEAHVMLEKSTWRKALEDCVLLADDYGIAAKLCRQTPICNGGVGERREPQNGRS